MNLLLDSTILIDLLRKRADVTRLVDGALEFGAVLFVSAINVGEVYSGMRPGEEEQTAALFDNLLCLPVSDTLARRAGELGGVLRRRGITVTLDDMIVAATALERDLMLMTDNRKDFASSGVRFWPE